MRVSNKDAVAALMAEMAGGGEVADQPPPQSADPPPPQADPVTPKEPKADEDDDFSNVYQ
jgi:hypothetical protein